MIEIGLRVVRGPNWQWGDQDGGEGGVGTVVEIGGRQNATTSTPVGTVIVQWDNGQRSNYRCGYEDAFDLCIIDNGAIGVRHPEIVCKGCGRRTIRGIRWKCTKCADVDLCTACYSAERHPLTHSFYRIDTPASRCVKVAKRSDSMRVEARGIFQHAKVVRGPDWNWGDQDGGSGQLGLVLDIRGWESETYRSVATVRWISSSVTNVYRVGHKGKVDLRCTDSASGGNYYKGHLAVLGYGVAVGTQPANAPFKIGDTVRVTPDYIDVDTLKLMQEGHGGWNAKMSECITKTGKVHRITEKGDIRVQYEGNVRWTFNPTVLTKLSDGPSSGPVSLSMAVSTTASIASQPGSLATVPSSALATHASDASFALSSLRESLLLNANNNGPDLPAPGDSPTFTPVAPNAPAREASPTQSSASPQHQQLLERLLAATSAGDLPGAESLLRSLLASLASNSLTAELANAADDSTPTSDGRIVVPPALKSTFCPLINRPIFALSNNLQGKTLLCAAVISGQQAMLELLLSLGVDPNSSDEFEDRYVSALHLACESGRAEMVARLLRAGADPNRQIEPLVSSRREHHSSDAATLALASVLLPGRTALHVAIERQQVECVRELLRALPSQQKPSLTTESAGAPGGAIDGLSQALQVLQLDSSAPGTSGASAPLSEKPPLNLNKSDVNENTPLHEAVLRLREASQQDTQSKPRAAQIFQMLLQCPEADPTARNHRGFNVFQFACLKGCLVAVTSLLDAFVSEHESPAGSGGGAQRSPTTSGPRRRISIELLTAPKQDGFSPLHIAALNDHAGIVEELLARGAPVDQRNNKQQTPLMLAASSNNLRCIELLVEKGNADVNAVDETGASSLFFPLLPFSDAVQQQQQLLQLSARSANALTGPSPTPPLPGANRQSVQLTSLTPAGLSQALGAAAAAGAILSRGSLAASGALPASFQALRTQLQSVIEKLAPMQSASTSDTAVTGSNVPVGQAPSSLPSSSGGVTLNVPSSAQPPSLNFADEALPTAVLVMAYLIRHGANWHHKNKEGHTIFDEFRNLKRLYLDVEQRRYMTPGSAPNSAQQLRNIPNSNASILRELTVLDEAMQRITRKQFLQKILPSEQFCLLCLDELVEVEFMPCGHRLVCESCCLRMKRCLKCQEAITEKRRLTDGKPAGSEVTPPAPPPIVATTTSNVHVGPSGSNVVHAKPAVEREKMELYSEVQQLRTQLRDFESRVQCQICMDRLRDTLLQPCGHTLCHQCCQNMISGGRQPVTCPFCRKTIKGHVNMYTG